MTNNTAVDARGSLTETDNIVANGTMDSSVVVGFNNNSKSQAANMGAGSTDMELAIPLSLIGNPTGSVQALVCINGSSFVYLSNQFIYGFKNFAIRERRKTVLGSCKKHGERIKMITLF